MRTAVITTVSNRREHLINQHDALGGSASVPDLYVIVALDAPAGAASDWLSMHAPTATVLHMGGAPDQLPVAAGRNLGARHAMERGADLLRFLDVDCVPTPTLLSAYADAARIYPDAVLSGAVGYLPEGADAFSPVRAEKAYFHDFRPRLLPCHTERADPALFWSLSFAMTGLTWQRAGGFCEDYVGYGAEDTDFAQIASRRGIPFLWVGGAEAFHQYHPVQSPPIEHLEDILRNGRLFASRWGFWPMTGWLDAFESRGLVTRDIATGDWRMVEEHL